ncbi:hypothetical protein G6F56_011615 [Rhizopus delemar]|nr:hypothetical protein G6F56_011615 [Rhizopus delemar]
MFVESRDKTLIEISVQYQGPKNQTKAPAIIIAHPYGPLGGNYITVCLNFRGCGKSQGRTSWTGMPEREDYSSVIDFILDQHEDYKNLNFPQVNSLIICGYSFGAMIANSIECTRVPCSYLLVSFCLGVTWALATIKSSFFKTPVSDRFKVLCIFGDHDQFTSTSRYQKWSNHQNITCLKVPEADHFWFGLEHTLINHVDHWLLTL